VGDVMADRRLRLQVSEEDADSQHLAKLIGYLRAELLQLDVEDLSTPRESEPPAGARVAGAAAVGSLLITLGHSAEGLQAVVAVITSWLRRAEGPGRTVRLELDGDALELSQVGAADQERLIDLFVSRHCRAETGR
jgi:hypothetical protein